MSFSAGLSGVAAANKDLAVTGNNVANASTVGFKTSRAEFGDSYTTSILGTGGDSIGSGVNVDAVAQKFSQGNITQTESVFDLAIDGSGFFVLGYDNGAQTYSRAGMFGVDKDGYITNSGGGKLQGFGVDENGIVSGILQDLQIESGNQPPKGTQGVEAQVNVSAGASVLQQLGSITRTNGLAVGVAQVGQPEATNSVLSTVGIPTTAGTESYLVSDVNLADRLVAGETTPMANYFQSSNITSYNTLQTDQVTLPGTYPGALAISSTLTIHTSAGSSTISPFTGGVPTTDAELRAKIANAINNDATLSGHISIHDNPNVANTLEFFTTDGTTIINPPVDDGVIATFIGYDSGLAPTISANDRLLLNDFVPGDGDIDFTYSDGVSDTTVTLALVGSPGNYATQADFITDLNTQLGGAGLGGNFIAQQDPFNPNGIEIVADINGAVANADYSVSSIVDSNGTLATDLGLATGGPSSRFFQNPPGSFDTVQIQIQDPNVNGGAPYTALIRPYPDENPILSKADLIASFQEELDSDPVLSGRLIFQESDTTDTFELISSTGTRIVSATDSTGSIANDLGFESSPSSINSLFSTLPPTITSTIDITIQGPNLEGGSQLTETIEPFPSGAEINNMNDLIASFQASIDSNQYLAGKLRVSEDPVQTGHLLIETTGSFATDGTNISSIIDNDGTLATDLGLSTATINSPIAGTDLFANGGSIDLTTIEGTSVTVQGNLESEFIFNNFESGTASYIAGDGLTAINPFGSALTPGNSFTMGIVSGAESGEITVTVDATGFATPSAVVDAINVGIAGDSNLNGVVQASLSASSELVITNVSTGAQSISVTEGTGTNNTGVATPVDVVLGLTTASTPPPEFTLGSEDLAFNNELTLTIGGDDPGVGTIRIPAATYTTTAQIIDALNSQITANSQLTGQVEAIDVNGRIVFSLDEVGGFPNSLTVTGTDAALEAFGHASQSTPPAVDPVDRRNSFRVNLSVPLPDEDRRSGSVEVSLDENIRSIDQLASAINRELNAAEEDEYIGVRAEVVTNLDGEKTLQFVATESGEASQISVTNVQAIGEDITEQEIYGMLQVDAFDENLLVTGEPQVMNGYPEQSFILYDAENDVRREVTIDENLQASQIASQLSQLAGMKATAETEVTIFSQDYINSGQMDIVINGQVIMADELEDMAAEINQYQQTTLSGITASWDEETGDLMLTSSIGTDIKIQTESLVETDTLTLRGVEGTAPTVLGGLNNDETTALVGGVVEIVLNEGYTMIEPDPRVIGLFNGLTANSFEDYVINSFDAGDPETYNDTASLTMYDSLGNQHRLQMYFVKEPDDPQRPLDLNYWTVYAQMDGENVGDPDPSLPYPQNLEPTVASHRMYFNADGTLDTESTGPWLVSNWDPIDESGNSNGAFTSLNVAEGGSLPISSVSTSSNFEIDLSGSTQYGGPFSRANFQQDGYSSGRLKDLEVGDDGIIYARYTNGEAQILGQVATASFQNVEGLTQMGSTEWQESFDSGDPTIGEPGTGVLGSLRSSALEDSTVDLSEQLVNLIIAQRNYQASAKTIETANAVTQTIINLR